MGDPRAERSKQYLKEALLILLLNHPYEKITVGQIAKKAGVNRSTFYTSYHSKDSLLKETVHDALDKIHGALYADRHLEENRVIDLHTIHPSFIRLFDGIYEARGYYKAILQTQFKYEFIEAIYNELLSFGKKHLKYEFSGEVSLIDTEVHMEYSMSALVGVILYWIRTSFQESPAEIALKVSVIKQSLPTRVLFS